MSKAWRSVAGQRGRQAVHGSLLLTWQMGVEPSWGWSCSGHGGMDVDWVESERRRGQITST